MDPTPASEASERQHLLAAIQALEAQRGILGDALVQAAVKPLQDRLTRLQGAPHAGQVRRQVSVLFLDVVGSTALSQVLDPEDIHALVDGCLQRCTAVVQNHGGRVLQYAGDSLLAAFGTEPSQEDEAERAVHCGLRLLAEGRVLGQQALRDHGHSGCDVRVGIHTGPVLLGGGVDDEGSIRGLAVNIAARMEQTAPPGSLRISHDTWLLVRGAFESQPQPPLQVKGSDEPLVTYLVQRARPVMEQVSARGIEGMRAPLVGRRDELSAVQGLIQSVEESGRLQAITLLGESGVGKSRLTQEFQARVEQQRERAWVLLARAHPPSRLQTYGVLRNLLAWQFLIPDSDSNEQARHRLVEGLKPWLSGTPQNIEGKAHWIGQLIGLDCSQHPALRNLEPSAVRQYAFAALHEVLRNLGAGGRVPVVLVEDLQWADDGSLDFLHGLMTDPQAPALAMLATARLELLERRPQWGEGASQHRSLLLKPLSPTDARTMVGALLAPLQGQGDALCERLVTLADGNPFFLEELVRMCLDRGVVVPETPARWRVVPERLGEARMPTTLVGVVQSRLDALSPAERSALQQAAVVGHVFWESALASMDVQAPQSLPALQARALVLPRKASSFEGTAEKAFGHHLLQQVTYDSVLRPARQAGHATTAAWLAERVGDRSSEFLSITAHHFEQAGQLAQASLFYERAAREAADRFANAAVIEHVEFALRCADPTDLRRQFDLRTLRQTAADIAGRRAEQEVDVRARLALAVQLGDDALLASATFGEALLASRRSNHAEALRLAAEAMALADRSGAPVPAALARAQLAWSHHAQGDSATALPLAEQAVECARTALAQRDTLEHRALLARVMAIHSGVLNGAGQLQRSHVVRQEGLQRAQADGLRILQALFRDQMGTYYAETGQDLAALPHFEAGAALARELGNSFSEAITRYNLACSLHSLTRFDESMEQVLAALKLVMDAEMTEVQGRCHLLIGRLHLDDGAEVRAQLAFQACIEAFAAAGLPHYESQGHAGLALLALGQGDLERARASAEEVDQRIQNNDALVGIDSPCLPLLACWKVWHRTGDPRALPALRRVVNNVQKIAQLAGDDEALRRGVLENVPLHREVMEAWRTHGDGAAALKEGAPAPK